MDTTKLKTHFAPPERADEAAVIADYERIRSNEEIVALLHGFPEPAVILNDNRQVVMANDKMETLLGKSAPEMIGGRPGELVGCIHAWEEEAGCGTSHSCRYCGAGRAIATCVEARDTQVQECRIATGEDGSTALDLKVWTRSIHVGGRRFTVFAIRDTSDEKRRAVLERLFFHDIINSAGGLRGLLELVEGEGNGDDAELIDDARRLSAQLVEEIQAQKDLAAAERGELEVRLRECDAAALIRDAIAAYAHHDVASGKSIRLEGKPEGKVRTDPVLLGRILGNLVKNALEASDRGDAVTVSFRNGNEPSFSVHNRTVMPENVRLQVFKRSFSTKGTPGRGIGTWSVKLLTERYLDGRVEFRSVAGEGTTFTVTLPAAE